MHIHDEMKVAHIGTKLDHGGPDDKDLAAKIRLTSETNVDKMSGLFTSPAAFKAAVESFYNEDGSLTVPELGVIELNRKGTSLVIKLKTEFGDGVEFTEKNEMGAIAYQLLPGHRCELSVKVLVHPNEEQYGSLGSMLGKGVTVTAKMKDSVEAEKKAEQAQQKLAVDMPQAEAAEPKTKGPKHRVKGARQRPPGSVVGDGEKPTVN